jgi:MFS family permease
VTGVADLAQEVAPDSKKPRFGAVGRTTWLLTGCQALYFSCVSIDLTLTGIVGLHMAPTVALATLPLAMITIVGTFGSAVAGLLTTRIGYPAVMICGAGAAVVGGGLSAYAVFVGSFSLLCVGTGLVGLYRATGGYIRFMAADRAPEGMRERALSFILFGGLVAAFAGPFLATASSGLVATGFVGSYLAVAVVSLLSVPLILAVGAERGAQAIETEKVAAVPVRDVAKSWDFITAMLILSVSGAAMTMIMAVGPIANKTAGHSMSTGASIIQWHLVGMFAPSLFSGSLMRRIGRGPTSVLGCGLLIAGGLAGATGSAYLNFLTALALNGIGWNLLYVTGSAYLIRTYPSGRGGRIQSVVEGTSSAIAVVSSFSASAVYYLLGWQRTNLPVIVLGVVVLGWLLVPSLRSRRLRRDDA